ncbi:hypothetical protein MN608_11591 [Microdochium nivale]|nr:hypothetical protein MN608_11591 [Microdochium nivale]
MHPCSHMSVKWMFCPKAPFDPSTGFQIGPCRSPNYYPEQSVAKPCSLQNCAFKALGGAWLCCQCGQGPNELGWCTATAADSSSSPPFAGSDVEGDWSYADSVSGCWNPDNCLGSCGHGCCSSCLPFDLGDTRTDGQSSVATANNSSGSSSGNSSRKSRGKDKPSSPSGRKGRHHS